VKELNSLLTKISNINYHTNVYGFVRSLLALALLLTILLNGKEYLFPNSFSYKMINNYDYFNLFKLLGHEHINLSLVISVVILLWVISGYLPQLSGVFHYFIANSFFHSTLLMDGGDQISSNLCLILIPFTITDKRLNHWSVSNKTPSLYGNIICYFSLFLVCLQMSVLYFHAAISKINVADWLNGTACYYWFTHNTFGVSDDFSPLFFKLLSNRYIVSSFTWGTILLETLLFAAIFMNQSLKKKLLIMGIIFHISIWLIHGLFSFSIAMCAGLIIYLYPIQNFLFIKRVKD
jgi:antimicrobial peptide system SdpB family protein